MMATSSQRLRAALNIITALRPPNPNPPGSTAGLCRSQCAALQLRNKREKPPGDGVPLPVPKSLFTGQGEQGLHARFICTCDELSTKTSFEMCLPV